MGEGVETGASAVGPTTAVPDPTERQLAADEVEGEVVCVDRPGSGGALQFVVAVVVVPVPVDGERMVAGR